jgi:hypothetical protein
VTATTFDRAVDTVRTGVAGIAVAAALFLLLRVPLLASFRAAILVLAALEVLASGRRMLSGGPWARELTTLGVKAAILVAAYLALGPLG